MSTVVGNFHTDNMPPVPVGHQRSHVRIKIVQVLFMNTAHPFASDIDKGEDKGLRTVDHLLFEVINVSPAGTSHINNCYITCTECETLRKKRIEAVDVDFER